MTLETIAALVGILAVVLAGAAYLHNKIESAKRESKEHTDKSIIAERAQAAQLYAQRADFTALVERMNAVENTLHQIDNKIDRIMDALR